MAPTPPENAAEIKELCRKSLDTARMGTDPTGIQNGKDFYKFFFTNYPDLRVYFKGAENFTAEDVQKSERFAQQGQRILQAIHMAVDTFDDDVAFKGYIRETINRHKIFKMDPNLWNASMLRFSDFLDSRIPFDDKTKDAWKKLDAYFSECCNDYLKSIGELKGN
ncbi:intracellular globin [Aphelenchoides avenae]|nr:intracellular globin [Aphelenchus avenae]